MRNGPLCPGVPTVYKFFLHLGWLHRIRLGPVPYRYVEYQIRVGFYLLNRLPSGFVFCTRPSVLVFSDRVHEVYTRWDIVIKKHVTNLRCMSVNLFTRVVAQTLVADLGSIEPVSYLYDRYFRSLGNLWCVPIVWSKSYLCDSVIELCVRRDMPFSRSVIQRFSGIRIVSCVISNNYKCTLFKFDVYVLCEPGATSLSF